ncbi:MAG: hypothetical protein OXE50_07885 [Chloroflexi bacterium]|nr:hypothetical protein [Chloroflexota bacterium]
MHAFRANSGACSDGYARAHPDASSPDSDRNARADGDPYPYSYVYPDSDTHAEAGPHIHTRSHGDAYACSH